MTSTSAWTVNVPVNDLLALMGLKDDLDRVTAENAQLRREMDGLRRVQSESMEKLGDLRRVCDSIARHFKI